MTPVSRRTVVFGASGLLGRALVRRFAAGAGAAVLTVPWAEAGPRARVASDEAFGSWLAERMGPGPCDVLLACGLVDPAAPPGDLEFSNHLFPRRVMAAAWELDAHRFLTFGTVHEAWDAACEANAYFASKRRLGDWVQAAARRPGAEGRLLHLRLHTLYGLPLHPRMFLGQMVAALRAGSPFAMSAGRQLREYHHADDLAEAVFRLCHMPQLPGPLLTLSSGRPLRLADLAREVFSAIGRSDLLRMGAIAAMEGDNTEQVFPATDPSIYPPGRDPVAGVVATLRAALAEAGG